jgi:small subunit ribosomal protein S12
MPTNTQLLKTNFRVTQYTKDRKKALDKCPQKKGLCTRVYITTPKKPNSAKRKVAKVVLTNYVKVIAYIDGIGHTLQKHGSVLVRGGRRKDLPGVRYRTIRGKFDLNIESAERASARSKYGQGFSNLTRQALINRKTDILERKRARGLL